MAFRLRKASQNIAKLNKARETYGFRNVCTSESKIFFKHKKKSFKQTSCLFDVKVLNQMSNNKGGILILNVTIDAKNFVLINLYNLDTENEKVEVLNTLLTKMRTIEKNENSNLY